MCQPFTYIDYSEYVIDYTNTNTVFLLKRGLSIPEKTDVFSITTTFIVGIITILASVLILQYTKSLSGTNIACA